MGRGESYLKTQWFPPFYMLGTFFTKANRGIEGVNSRPVYTRDRIEKKENIVIRSLGATSLRSVTYGTTVSFIR